MLSKNLYIIVCGVTTRVPPLPSFNYPWRLHDTGTQHLPIIAPRTPTTCPEKRIARLGITKKIGSGSCLFRTQKYSVSARFYLFLGYANFSERLVVRLCDRLGSIEVHPLFAVLFISQKAVLIMKKSRKKPSQNQAANPYGFLFPNIIGNMPLSGSYTITTSTAIMCMNTDDSDSLTATTYINPFRER